MKKELHPLSHIDTKEAFPRVYPLYQLILEWPHKIVNTCKCCKPDPRDKDVEEI